MIGPNARATTDLTALAVRADNLRAGVAAAGADGKGSQAPASSADLAPDRGPAVQMDAQTRRLADAIAGAEANQVQADGGDSVPRPVSNARREMVAAMAHGVEALQRQIRDIGETLQIYEETGRVAEVQTTFSTGNAKQMEELNAEALQPWGGAEGFISMLRERRENIIGTALPRAQKTLSDFLAGR